MTNQQPDSQIKNNDSSYSPEVLDLSKMSGGAIRDIASGLLQLVLVTEPAPCQEVVLTGDDVDLYKFPILKWHPGDGGPYITQTAVITKDSHFGTNIGMYRMMVHDKNSTGLMF